MGLLWRNMPDSLLPAYINADKRNAMVDYYNMGETAEVMNELDGISVMDTLTATYAKVTLSSALDMQLALLPTAKGDTVICRVSTVSAPAKESRVEFFDLKWNRLPTTDFLDEVPAEQLLARPDTLNEEEFRQLCSFFEPRMVYVQLAPEPSQNTESPNKNENFTLSFSLSTPLTSKYDKEKLEPIMVQRKLKWNGEKYK